MLCELYTHEYSYTSSHNSRHAGSTLKAGTGRLPVTPLPCLQAVIWVRHFQGCSLWSLDSKDCVISCAGQLCNIFICYIQAGTIGCVFSHVLDAVFKGFDVLLQILFILLQKTEKMRAAQETVKPCCRTSSTEVCSSYQQYIPGSWAFEMPGAQ